MEAASTMISRMAELFWRNPRLMKVGSMEVEQHGDPPLDRLCEYVAPRPDLIEPVELNELLFTYFIGFRPSGQTRAFEDEVGLHLPSLRFEEELDGTLMATEDRDAEAAAREIDYREFHQHGSVLLDAGRCRRIITVILFPGVGWANDYCALIQQSPNRIEEVPVIPAHMLEELRQERAALAAKGKFLVSVGRFGGGTYDGIRRKQVPTY